MENALFISAMKKSLEAKSHVDKTVSGDMDFMNLPSKNDVAKLMEEMQRVRSRMVKQQRLLVEIKTMLSRREDE